MEPENKFLEHFGLRTALIWAIIVFVGLPAWILLGHSGLVNGPGIGAEIVFNLICLVPIRYITRLVLWGAAYILEDFPKTSKIVYRG